MAGKKKIAPKSARDQRGAPPKKEEPKKEIAKSVATTIVEPKVMDQIRKDVPKMKYVTPYQLYSKYNLRYSISKDILESLAKQGNLKLAKSTRRVDIYVPA